MMMMMTTTMTTMTLLPMVFQGLLENAGIITQLGYDHFLLNHFLLITAQSLCHSTLYNEILTAS
jgi:hypothetical protein